jgi:hypothetical protein
MQKTLLGYTYKQFKSKMYACDLMGGGTGLVVTLRVPKQTFSRQFRVTDETDEWIILSSGVSLFQISKE